MSRFEIEARIDLIIGKQTTTRYVSKRQGKPSTKRRKKARR